jgi:hypothetical protein
MDDSTLALGVMQAPFGRDAYAHACGIRCCNVPKDAFVVLVQHFLG